MHSQIVTGTCAPEILRPQDSEVEGNNGLLSSGPSLYIDNGILGDVK